MFLVIMEFAFIVLAALFAWTQIIKPIFLGLPLFPVLRKTEKIHETIIQKQGELHNEELLDRVDELDTKIIEKKSKRSPQK